MSTSFIFSQALNQKLSFHKYAEICGDGNKTDGSVSIFFNIFCLCWKLIKHSDRHKRENRIYNH